MQMSFSVPVAIFMPTFSLLEFVRSFLCFLDRYVHAEIWKPG